MTKTGIIITTLNDYEELVTMFASLRGSIGINECPIVLIDGLMEGVRPFNLEAFCKNNAIEFLGVTANLTTALNKGTFKLMERQCEYILWVHTDMVFDNQQWIEQLVKYMDETPKTGKATPRNWNLDNCDKDRPGNGCPTIIRREVVDKVVKKYGEFYDENYLGACCWDDDDINRKIVALEYDIIVTPRSTVWHKGMGTRGRIPRKEWEVKNTIYHHKKWKSNGMIV